MRARENAISAVSLPAKTAESSRQTRMAKTDNQSKRFIA
jgi:hypothetical protein